MKQNQELSRLRGQQDIVVTRRSVLAKTKTVAIVLFGLRFLPAANLSLDKTVCRDELNQPGNLGDVGNDLQAACDKSDREEFLRWVGEHMLSGAREQMTREDGPDHV